jgi:hypothetical protein
MRPRHQLRDEEGSHRQNGSGRPSVVYGGAFDGNPTSVAAAKATLDYPCDHQSMYAEINAQGARIGREVTAAPKARWAAAQSSLGGGSIFSFRFVDGPVTSIRDLVQKDPTLPEALSCCSWQKALLYAVPQLPQRRSHRRRCEAGDRGVRRCTVVGRTPPRISTRRCTDRRLGRKPDCWRKSTRSAQLNRSRHQYKRRLGCLPQRGRRWTPPLKGASAEQLVS